ncbi:hypothetical protein EON63_13385 [archaeon]|nr:MAG: hypothetical protein EON63_13385 [archaeon]
MCEFIHHKAPCTIYHTPYIIYHTLFTIHHSTHTIHHTPFAPTPYLPHTHIGIMYEQIKPHHLRPLLPVIRITLPGGLAHRINLWQRGTGEPS